MSKQLYAIIGIIVLMLIAGGITLSRRSTANTPDSGQIIVPSDDAQVIDGAASSTPATSESSTTPATSTTNATSTGTTITFTDAEFSPNSVSIKAGQSVTFKNESASPVWVASDPHPTHTKLSGFDARKSIKQGETYTFTFTKAGTWGYHDHNNASQTGTVVVE